MDNYQAKLEALAAKLQEETQTRLVEDDLACEGNMLNAVTSIKPGRKYDKIDIGPSGRLMVDKASGEVFGISAYGQINKRHAYGTLDTIADWFWGIYYPVLRSKLFVGVPHKSI